MKCLPSRFAALAVVGSLALASWSPVALAQGSDDCGSAQVISGTGLFLFLRKDKVSRVEDSLSDEEKKKIDDLLS